MNRQYLHSEYPFSEKKHPITLICDNVISPANVGSLFRICDAFGAEELIFCGTEIDVNSPRLKKTARSTIENTPYKCVENTSGLITKFKENGYLICALEITSESKPVNEFKINEDQKVVLIIGNEKHGISENMLKSSDYCLHIPMYGKNSSMNVTTATAVCLYTIISTHFES
ncbi:TrmH family RNA methyltransferase [Patiriisocius hiemis]|uniref:TrmH family RNA methyltransferase n=1 Tax=Patiriisocius hiemis TaxID=3075604 RepID=A0ABU2Y9C6_9FLAO|nr:TrmH family RNA methyltransferase [Constantimarinum sp. W242]MDT0554780.1 TrmH family RNA methyltransferase [Constantimarinum sp. W242]